MTPTIFGLDVFRLDRAIPPYFPGRRGKSDWRFV
jgi:hypothetical protein